MLNFESLKYVIYRIFFAKQLNIDLRFMFKDFNRYMFILLSDFILHWFVLNTETFVSMETFSKLTKIKLFKNYFSKQIIKDNFVEHLDLKLKIVLKKIKQLKK